MRTGYSEYKDVAHQTYAEKGLVHLQLQHPKEGVLARVIMSIGEARLTVKRLEWAIEAAKEQEDDNEEAGR